LTLWFQFPSEDDDSPNSVSPFPTSPSPHIDNHNGGNADGDDDHTTDAVAPLRAFASPGPSSSPPPSSVSQHDASTKGTDEKSSEGSSQVNGEEFNASVVVDETTELPSEVKSSEELPSQVDDETVVPSQEPAEILESDTGHVAATAQEGDEDASGSKPSTPQQR
jgi:hypothetical protein